VRWFLRGFYVICGILLLLDLIIHRHALHSFERLTGFYPLFGFIACVVLVLVAREMRKLLKRDEDYYESREERSRDD
jgi:hypothetical protein